MAFVLTLQLLMLLFATTGFAAPSTGCPSPSLIKDSPSFGKFRLSSVFLGVGQMSYNCTDPGKYEMVGIEIELFEATCVNGGVYLEEIVKTTVANVHDNPYTGTSEWGVFVEEKFDLNTAGKLKSSNSTSFEIDLGLSKYTSSIVSITGDYGDGQGQQMVNEDKTSLVSLVVSVVEADGQSPSTCAAGSSGSVDVVTLLYDYELETQNNS